MAAPGQRMADRLLVLGLAGSVVTAVCCFTPVLVLLLGALGLAAWSGYLDYVLLPLLALFLLLVGVALVRRRRLARRG